MGKENNAKLCNALIKTIRVIATRLHDDQLAPNLKKELRPLFRDCRKSALFYYEHLRKDDNSDLALPMEWKMVKTIGEEIASCEDILIMKKMKTFKEYLDICVEDLPPLEEVGTTDEMENDEEEDWDVSSLDVLEIDITEITENP